MRHRPRGAARGRPAERGRSLVVHQVPVGDRIGAGRPGDCQAEGQAAQSRAARRRGWRNWGCTFMSGSFDGGGPPPARGPAAECGVHQLPQTRHAITGVHPSNGEGCRAGRDVGALLAFGSAGRQQRPRRQTASCRSTPVVVLARGTRGILAGRDWRAYRHGVPRCVLQSPWPRPSPFPRPSPLLAHAAQTSCALTYNMSGGGVFYKHSTGDGVIKCDNGQTWRSASNPRAEGSRSASPRSRMVLASSPRSTTSATWSAATRPPRRTTATPTTPPRRRWSPRARSRSR